MIDTELIKQRISCFAKVIKHKGYTYWQSPLTKTGYLFDAEGRWVGYAKNNRETSKSDARYMIDDMLYQRERV